MTRNMAGIIFFAPLLFAACSFNYGESGEEEGGPDIIMREVEYVRVRDGAPQIRFTAEEAERWEKRQVMELAEFSFEQFEKQGEEINSRGSAGLAHVELDSGDIDMTGGVRMEVDSEDFTIDTATLSWQDGDHRLSGGPGEAVDIQRSDGTFFQGQGFSADVRKRTWVFSGNVEGSYVHEDAEEDEEAVGEAEDAGEAENAE
jgi:LPS export ABC transporter protein LptC